MPKGAGSGAPPGAVLLTTKLHAPARRLELVERRRLVEQLIATEPRLTVVGAGAGWGKTTLLAEWRSREPRRIAWLSLEPSDNDPGRFWTYVATALQSVVPGLGAGVLPLLRTPGTSVLDSVLPLLLEDLAALSGRYFLVPDNYHAITNRDLHEQTAYFVERLPPALRFVIASRADPPLPLGRLRARGDLGEVRADALRFSAAETATFLNNVLRLDLTESDVARLHERTEGWAAGLYLAGLSLRGRTNRAELIDAVAGRAGSAATLEAIERSNLFLVALDARREWYRYHQLFGELLANELRRTDPARLPVLHHRAFDWLRDHGSPEEAIHHAVAAGELEDAAELIVDHWNGVFNHGRLATVTAWLDALPPATIEG